MGSKKKELLVIVSGLRKAGAELMLFRMLKHLDRNHFNINVISLTSEGGVGMMLTSLGIRVHALHIDGFINLIFGFARLIRLIRKICPDVVQTWMYHADMLGGLAARIAGISNIAWSIRNSSLSLDTTKISTYAAAKICSIFSSWLPKIIINCSESARDSHVSFGYSAEKMVVVPNGFELDRFIPVNGARNAIRSELCLSSERQIVGLIGRYHPIKNHAGFIKAALKISSINPNVNFLLTGEGVDISNSELLQLIHSANLLERFHLLGQRSDMPLIMSSLDVLVSASLGEAFPNVIGEAMACGIPCVATDVGDTAYIIGDTGKVVPVNDSESLADSVLEILSLKQEDRILLGMKTRERITEYFDINIISSIYQRYYEEMI
jgi:glycosyltransferase involved in cell wall biosynthesis